jgi:hypothetical protein
MKSLKNRMALVLVFLFSVPLLNAQIDSLINLPNLLIPRFTRSIVKMKSGETRTAILNYNTVDQQMVFMQKKLFYVLDDPQLIDTIYMANKIFIPFEKGFYELALSAPITLFVQHKSYVESSGFPTGYGAMSQTTAPSYVRQIYGINGAINLRMPQNYKITDDSQCWIRKDGTMTQFSTKKQFLKIFPDKETELEKYISKNKTDFKNLQKIVELMIYCNGLYK